MRQVAWVLGMFLAAAVGLVSVWALIEPGRDWAAPALALAGGAALYPMLRKGGAGRFMAALELVFIMGWCLAANVMSGAYGFLARRTHADEIIDARVPPSSGPAYAQALLAALSDSDHYVRAGAVDRLEPARVGEEAARAALERAQNDPDELVSRLARIKLDQLPRRDAPVRR